MTRRPANPKDEGAQIDITPMLDVVFILLIFFIVTATFTREAGIEVTRPDGTAFEVPENGSILIAITADDEIWINRRKVDFRLVRPNIERLRAEDPKRSIVIQADKDSRNESLVKVMDASRAAGVYSISLAESTS